MPRGRNGRAFRRNQRRSRPRNSNPRRKNSRFPKKKAYAPARKKRFINKSNPIAENKQVEGAELSATIGNNPDGTRVLLDMSNPPPTLPNASGHAMNTTNYVFIPDSPCYQTQGLDESQMSGRSTYQRLCACKMLIKWPQKTMNTGISLYPDAGGPNDYLMGELPSTPQSYKLYWGYVPIKHMFTGRTDPVATEASAFQLETLVKQRISDYFDSRRDRIAFIPKRTSTINIIGSKTLSAPNYNFNRIPVSTEVDGEVSSDGSIADTLVKITWPINKKIHFQPSNKFAWDKTIPAGESDPIGPVAPSSGATVFYRNYDHIPFAVIVSWNNDKLPENDTSITTPEDLDEFKDKYARTMRVPHVLINDITYYRDS